VQEADEDFEQLLHACGSPGLGSGNPPAFSRRLPDGPDREFPHEQDAISGAGAMAVLNDKQAKLFTDRNWGVIATVREDGSPQATPVWIDYDGEKVLVNSAYGRTKVKNIERDPRATVTSCPPRTSRAATRW
jgi:predicted pyridoxine 5'-phosphate oxidase superfamily flavin-nucleotide-binding protein